MKKRIGKIKRKLNNAGMTLIEILVAMALLVVAIIPLSAGYIYSAQRSVKAKHRQQTSILAHTMIENCKAYSYEQIQTMISAGTFMPNTDAADHYTDPNVANQFYFDDVQVFDDASGNSQQYDLRMTITPISASNKDIMVYNNMNRYTDAVFNVQTATTSSGVVARDCDVEAYKYALTCIMNDVNAHGALQTGTFSPISLSDADTSLKVGGGGTNAGKLEMTRTININMDDEGSPVNKQIIQVVYTYDFTFSGKYNYKIINDVGTEVPKEADITAIPDLSYSFTIYDNTNTYDAANGGAKAKNVFLFYYPSYNKSGMKFDKDIIAINNNLETDMNVHLMKQAKSASEISASELISEESNYGPLLQYSNSGSGKKAYVYHNLNINVGGGASTSWAPTYAYPELVLQNFDSTAPDNNPEALVDDTSKQLMYEVEVAIYSDDAFNYDMGTNTMSMTGDALASMDGTFLDW